MGEGHAGGFATCMAPCIRRGADVVWWLYVLEDDDRWGVGGALDGSGVWAVAGG